MDTGINIYEVIAIFIIVIAIVKTFSSKGAKNVSKDLGATLGVATTKVRVSMEKSVVTENLEWADDLLEEFGYSVDDAISASKTINAQLLEPATVTKAQRDK